MNAKRWMKLVAAGTIAAGAAVGCAHSDSAALQEARQMYQRAEQSHAAQLAPSHLDTARAALDRAEASYEDTGDSRDTRDLAYIAERLAMVAQAEADQVVAQENREEAMQELQLAQAQLEQQAQQMAQQPPPQPPPEINVEIADIGETREDERGTVVNLSGSVIFTSGSSQLLPAAERRLDMLANALKTMPERQILIEGFTDSTGSTALNERLSQERANSVRDFLVSRGVEEGRIEAVGRGETDFVAPNDTPEGRAMNRRVEVIILREEEPAVS